jgi:hypothetical protein
MLLAWENKADAAAISAGSEISTLPASNVQQVHISRKWHTAAAVKSSYLIFDMGSSISCALAALLGSNLTTAATLQLRASDLDPAVTSSLLLDTGVIAAGVKATYGAAYKAFAATAARYWRIDISDPSLPDNIQLGRVFLGPSWEPSVNMMLDWGIGVRDPSRRMKSHGGQTHIDRKQKARVIDFVLDFMAEVEMFEKAFAMSWANGITDDVLAVPDIDGAYLSEQAVFGLLDVSEPIRNQRLGIYTQRFSIEERL